MVEDFRNGVPPLVTDNVVNLPLQRFTHRPPVLGRLIFAHLRHISIHVCPHVLEVGKKQHAVAINRVVANVALADFGENTDLGFIGPTMGANVLTGFYPITGDLSSSKNLCFLT